MATRVVEFSSGGYEIRKIFALSKKGHHFKGQIISECPYEIIVWTKLPTKKISEISALASKERSNQKNKGTLLY